MEALMTTTTVSASSSILSPHKTNLKTDFFPQCQLIKFPRSIRNYQNATKLRFPNIIAQASSGSEKAISKDNSKDENVAFVAGATGKVGSRAVRELLKLGFQVRAGVRSPEKAQSLVQSVKQMSSAGETQPVEKLEIIRCDLEKKEEIGAALGNASVILCCIGASEKEIFDITGPYRIDYIATKNLIEAAARAKVDHFILLTSLGTNKIGFPAAILNLFWGVLLWKRKAEEALFSSGIPYTVVRPGGMERPTDTFKETHNLTLSQEDTLFGGLVSNLQVAELMACMARNRDLTYCKVVEVVAETTAPLTPMDELLKKIPSKRPGGFAPKKPTAPEPKIYVEEVITTTPEPKVSVEEVITTGPSPLSPYTAYEDLKPPTSPCPSPNTTVSAPTPTIVQESAAAKKSTPLSPYTAYADLKPPTSPRPTPNTTISAPTPTIVQEIAETKKSTPLSPYTAYEDLKPPTSPRPMPSGLQKPKSIVTEVAGGNGPPKISNEQSSPDLGTTVDKETQTEPKPRPLSPYTMYEDLKPPSSPSPSANSC